MPTPDDFVARTDPYRRELFAHCYRMLGSLHEAEDLVQEVYLRAWRGYDDFRGGSSIRTWLYVIATRACLNALDSRSRRALPYGLGPPNENHPGDPLAEQVWLQPLPDQLLGVGPVLGADPAEVAVARSRTRLAMIAALHTLSARERAAVILREVLGWPAAEVASTLETTAASVNSSLRRARARIALAEPREDEIIEPDDSDSRAMLDRYMTAFREADMALLVSILRDDVTIEMPPVPTWFAGIDRVSDFLAVRVSFADQWRMLPTIANGQPAAAAYVRDADGIHGAHSVQVLTTTTTGIQRVVAFRSPGLFAYFGVPEYL
jgi:RNA polymerase sigma-70 factor, ECF subfamily